MSGLSLGLAYILDLVVGDPAGWPHPVRLIGGLIDRLVSLARRHFRDSAGLRLAGVFIWMVTVGLTYILVILALRVSAKIAPELETVLTIILAYTTLATKDLYVQTWRVVAAVQDGDLPTARQFLGYVVGRETTGLPEPQILRAVIETISENLSDGVIAPLFYLALGGPAMALAYKAVNTLDSMIGYKDDRFKDLGWFSARADDVANYLPARISAALIVAAAALLRLDARRALTTWLREGQAHTSPNAGRPEAAMAGALQIQLGGPSIYYGQIVHKPTLGVAIYPLSPERARDAENIMLLASSLMVLAALGLGGWS